MSEIDYSIEEIQAMSEDKMRQILLNQVIEKREARRQAEAKEKEQKNALDAFFARKFNNLKK